MKLIKLSSITAFLISFLSVFVFAANMVSATESLKLLRDDIINGKIKVGLTRLKDLQSNYGEPIKIIKDEVKITYDYGDFKIDVVKDRYLKKWEYDSFKRPAYSSDIESLRKDLESGEIVGDYITAARIKKDYKEPTEYVENDIDGDKTIYYYGNIKLTFENYFTVSKWQGKNLGDEKSDLNNVEGALISSKNAQINLDEELPKLLKAAEGKQKEEAAK